MSVQATEEIHPNPHKKSRKSKRTEKTESLSLVPEDATEKGKKERKRKEKALVDQTEGSTKTKTKKSKQYDGSNTRESAGGRTGRDGEDGGGTPGTIVEKSREEENSKDDAAIGEKKKRKRKKDKAVDKDELDQEPKKKKRAVKTDIPDPRNDSSLADQSRRALVYAFTQFDASSEWKFNKARQNWLIRNMWSNQSIPEEYMPLLARYLAHVQGGIRENIIKACQVVISPPVPLPVNQADQAAQPATIEPVADTDKVPQPTPVADHVKQLRAHAILQVLSAPTENNTTS